MPQSTYSHQSILTAHSATLKQNYKAASIADLNKEMKALLDDLRQSSAELTEYRQIQKIQATEFSNQVVPTVQPPPPLKGDSCNSSSSAEPLQEVKAKQLEVLEKLAESIEADSHQAPELPARRKWSIKSEQWGMRYQPGPLSQ